MNAYGKIPKVLEKVKTAQTPARFTQDFLSTKLGFPGGSPKPVIPYLKRTGFLTASGEPTDIYKRFRNPDLSGAAAAEALRIGYNQLFEINEYANDLTDSKLKGVIVQATGLDEGASSVKAILGSFKALKAFADFDAGVGEGAMGDEGEVEDGNNGSTKAPVTKAGRSDLPAGVSLGYTINLNLPPTSDIAVFNAIFKSLKENMLSAD